MPKMTKTTARKLIKAARGKINKVMFVTDLDRYLSSRDNNELMKMWDRLGKIEKKFK